MTGSTGTDWYGCTLAGAGAEVSVGFLASAGTRKGGGGCKIFKQRPKNAWIYLHKFLALGAAFRIFTPRRCDALCFTPLSGAETTG